MRWCAADGLDWVRLGSRATQSRLPLFPQQQTLLSPAVTSVSCQQETHAPQQTLSLFDHLVGLSKERRRYRHAEGFRRLQIDHELELGGLNDR